MTETHRFPQKIGTTSPTRDSSGFAHPLDGGGLGGDFVAYALVSEEIGRHCATTALTFNMHTATALLAGWIADQLGMDNEQQSHLDRVRPQLWNGMCHQGIIHSQPFSEGRTPGSGQPIGTTAVPVEGGYKVTGKKIFASLSGIANIHNVVAHPSCRESAAAIFYFCRCCAVQGSEIET